MASTNKHHPLKICFMVMAFTVVTFFSPVINFAPALMWSKGAVLASNNASASRQPAQCDDDDYQYVKITEGTPDSSAVNPASNNLHFDARGLLRKHGRSQIIIRAYSKICWEGGIIYGNDAASSTRNIRRTKRRQVAAMQIVGYNRNTEVIIHSVGFFHLHNSVNVQGEINEIAILDSRFQNVDSCIDGLISGDLIVENSLIEDCEFIVQGSSLSKKSTNNHLLMIRNNVIRIDDKPPDSTKALQVADDESPASESGLAIEAHGNIFLVENDNAEIRLRDWLTGDLTECSDNIVVWLGPGGGPEDLPDCFSVTNEVGEWEEARSSWIRDHQIVDQHEDSLREPDETGEPLDLGDAESHGGSEGWADAQRSLQPESRGDGALAGLGASTLRSLAVAGFAGRGRIGSPWADGTLWSDGTGWKDVRRGSLVHCRESQGFRPLTGSTVCSP